MTIAEEANRIEELRDDIRDNLLTMDVLDNSSADLEDCAEAVGRISESYMGRLFGKNLYVYGDSIANGAGWAGAYGKIIADKYSMTLSNKAVDGASLASISSRSCIHSIVTSDTTLADADFIILEGGINDAWDSSFSNYGKVSDNWTGFTTSTSIGALENILNTIITTNPDATLIYVFPHKGMLTDGSDWEKILKPEIKKVLDKWNIPTIDIAECTPPMGTYGISALSTYLADNTHPNESGYKRWYANPIESMLLYALPVSKPDKEETTIAYGLKEVICEGISFGTTENPLTYTLTTAQANFENGDRIEGLFDWSQLNPTTGSSELFGMGVDISEWAGKNFHIYIENGRLDVQAVHVESAHWVEHDYIQFSSLPDPSNVSIVWGNGQVLVGGIECPNVSKVDSGVAPTIWSQIKTNGQCEIGRAQYPNQTVTCKYLKVMTQVEAKAESTVNKTTTISALSTNDEYPTAKAVYDLVGNIENVLS